MGKNEITPIRNSKDTDPPTQNDRLKEYLLNEFKKHSNRKKVFSELFVKKVITFSCKNKIDLEKDDTEVHARAVIPKMRRKWELWSKVFHNTEHSEFSTELHDQNCSFNKRWQQLVLFLFLKDSSWVNYTGVDQQLLDHWTI